MLEILYDVCAAGRTCRKCGEYAECDSPDTHAEPCDFRGCACR